MATEAANRPRPSPLKLWTTRMAESAVSDGGTRIGGLLEEALAQHRGGDLAGAERIYAAILEIDSGNPQVLTLLGTLQAQQGNFEDAQRSLSQSLKIEHRQPFALNSLGNVLHGLKRHGDAVARYEQAIALKPDHAAAYANRGNALRALGRHTEALASYDTAIENDPCYAEAYARRGDVLRELKRYDEAIRSYEKAIGLRPDDVQLLFNRAIALQESGRAEAAITGYDATIALQPNHAEAHSNRGNVLASFRRYDEAMESYRAAIAANPDYAVAYNNYSNALIDIQRYPDALKNIEAVLALEPAFPYALGQRLVIKAHMCDWEGLGALRDAAVEAIGRGSLACVPFSLVAVDVPPETRRRCAELYVQDRCPQASRPIDRHAKVLAPHRDRIRIAYVSADFHAHATAHLIAGVFEQHDRSRFEVYGISLGSSDGSPMRARLEAAFEHFVTVDTLDDYKVAALLSDAEIDVAVDLKGFTKNARPGIFALRPAPVQVSYLGFPATMGAGYIDYLVADKVVVPEGDQIHYSEKLAYLPDSYQCNDTKRRIGNRTPSREEAGLPASGFVFCSFNNNYKITPDVFDVWMRLLRQTEGSVLWILESNACAAQNLRLEAKRRGISPERLVFAPKVQHADHLARHRLADLFLDTLPCGAHTTASDALWAGLPMLTCVGDSFAGRVGASLLNAIGLPELVTQSLPDYERRALELAHGPVALTRVKEKLERNRETCPLFDTGRFTRHLEAAYLRMWERHRAGEPPASFSVQAFESAAGTAIR
jgi:predicted O-linked N-acetylglucosamine transferase (SPINDLY family)